MAETAGKNRADYVFAEMKKAILSLELKPGQPLSEQRVCEHFMVSRTPVREALRRLSEQGFVDTVPYSGTRVTLLDLEEIRQMIYMRTAVEFSVMRDFAAIATPLMYEDIRHQIRLQELLIRQPEFKTEDFYRLDAQMHACWFRETGRARLWDFVQINQYQYSRFRMLDFETETNFMRIIREHEGLLALMEAGSLPELEEALRRHLNISITRMKRAIEVDYKDYFVQPADGQGTPQFSGEKM